MTVTQDALKNGILKNGMTVIEPTSGNTGIGLAYAGAVLGIKVALVMPEHMSEERKLMMKAFGAELILTPKEKGMQGAIDKATELSATEPDKYYMPQQFNNPANPLIHEKTTAPEIWRDTEGQIDVFVAGVGTGGTISGVSRYLKAKKEIVSIAVEPAGSPVITQKLAGEEIKPGPHAIQGIGAGFIPGNLDLRMIDHVMTVEDEDAKETARRLAAEEGIISGISSGAAVAGAIQGVAKLQLKDKNIVIILPDSGERYLSSGLYK